MKRLIIIILCIIGLNAFADGTFDPTKNYQGKNAKAYLGEILYIKDLPEKVDYRTITAHEASFKEIVYERFFDYESFDGNDPYMCEYSTWDAFTEKYHYDFNFRFKQQGTEPKWLEGKRFRVFNVYPVTKMNIKDEWVLEMVNVDDPSDKVAYYYIGWYWDKPRDNGDILWIGGRFNNFPFLCEKYIKYQKSLKSN